MSPKPGGTAGCSEPGVGASSWTSAEAAKGSDACGAPKEKEMEATTARSGARRKWKVEGGDDADEDAFVSILRCGMYCFPNIIHKFYWLRLFTIRLFQVCIIELTDP